MIHGTEVLQSFNLSKVTTIILSKEVETFMIDELSHNFKGNLITPCVHEGHRHIIEEHSHLFTTKRYECTTLLTFEFGFNRLLEVERSCSARKVNSLEEHLILIELRGIH